VVRFTQPPYGTFDAAEWAPSTASKADIREMTCVKQKGRLARGGLSNDR
jgi:hypothetical protein